MELQGLYVLLCDRYILSHSGPRRGSRQSERTARTPLWRAAGLSLMSVGIATVGMVATAPGTGQTGLGQKVLARHAGPIQLRSAPVTVSIPLDGDSWAIQAAGDRGQLALDLDGVDFNGPSDVYYDIYVGLPAGVKNPGPNSPNLIGKLTPKARRELHPGSNYGTHVTYSIADVVHALTTYRVFNPEQLTITFIPRVLGGGQGGGPPERAGAVRARIAGLVIRSAN